LRQTCTDRTTFTAPRLERHRTTATNYQPRTSNYQPRARRTAFGPEYKVCHFIAEKAHY
jgi:hypothetical protein